MATHSERADVRFVDAGPVRLAYETAGDPGAPPLLLLHALGKDATDWHTVLPAFARHWHVYVPDLRGHGRSDWPGTYSFELMRDDVLGFLNALGIARASLVGHSLGGVVSYLLAAGHPERVDRLVLEEAPPPFPRQPSAPARPDHPVPYDWPVVPAIKAQVDTPDPAWPGLLDGITARTLLVAGGAASQLRQDWIAEMAGRIPGGRLVTIPAGHRVHETAPEAFTEAVTGFLRER
ncbi:alpha/beta fold hydrolase [Streptomyces litchfieldiae]|uniref:Alpha/beta hydrolase n=1 Tax=Streptomyces litchfieldiae TaxID=3075543 RepID=A0ABU2MZP1_9ACTN|nr:alpha/beta hydrolase [Streptomyces sp. DSM 44938]MDT0346981.1 alpha/beta hydrolase [Streptomyces sp. DSM 44938]